MIHNSDIRVDLANDKIKILNTKSEPWTITLVDTGPETMTGGRLKRIRDFIDDDFCFTYGDGLSDININNLVKYHKSHNKIATVTAVSPPGRFGILKIDNDDLVTNFDEKPIDGHGFINGGFFVLKPQILDYIEGDNTIFEEKPMYDLASTNQLKAFSHTGFWQCMDNNRDKTYLEILLNDNCAPWVKWDF